MCLADTLRPLKASVKQMLSLCNVSALKKGKQTLWEHMGVTPTVAYSQARCPLIDS